ncbi:MAG: hypothetical protein RJA63_2770 [Pseudomonadota bacterium]|jgi:hypothetical protein
MKLRYAIAACSLLLSHPTFASLSDADDFSEALAMAANTFDKVDQARVLCAEVMPESKRAITILSLKWEDRNREEYRAIWLYSKTAPSWWTSIRSSGSKAFPLGFSALSIEQKRNFCNSFYARVNATNEDFSSKSPRISALLRDYVKKPVGNAIHKEEFGFVIGCVKGRAEQRLNSGAEFDLDATRGQCECFWEHYSANTTPEERSNDKKVFEAPSSAPSEKMLRLTREGQRCFSNQ